METLACAAATLARKAAGSSCAMRSPFLHLRAFVHGEIDDAAGDLGADDHLVAVNDTYERNIAAARRGEQIDHQGNEENDGKQYGELFACHGIPAPSGVKRCSSNSIARACRLNRWGASKLRPATLLMIGAAAK